MKGMNKVILVGNLGKDPDSRYTQGGSAVSNVSLAVNERRKQGDEWKDHTEWVNLVAFGKTAEVLGRHCSKGSPIAVEGRIQTRKWQDKDGNTRYSTEVVVNDLVLLGSKGEKPARQEPAQPDRDSGGFDPNDDVPF